jgi:hypothetical protein
MERTNAASSLPQALHLQVRPSPASRHSTKAPSLRALAAHTRTLLKGVRSGSTVAECSSDQIARLRLARSTSQDRPALRARMLCTRRHVLPSSQTPSQSPRNTGYSCSVLLAEFILYILLRRLPPSSLRL